MNYSFGRILEKYPYTERLRRLEVFRILHNIELLNKDKLFDIALYRPTRGHPLRSFKRRARLNTRKNSFGIMVVYNWNSLPESVVMTPSLNAFKSRLNSHRHNHLSKFEPTCYPSEQPTRILTTGIHLYRLEIAYFDVNVT